MNHTKFHSNFPYTISLFIMIASFCIQSIHGKVHEQGILSNNTIFRTNEGLHSNLSENKISQLRVPTASKKPSVLKTAYLAEAANVSTQSGNVLMDVMQIPTRGKKRRRNGPKRASVSVYKAFNSSVKAKGVKIYDEQDFQGSCSEIPLSSFGCEALPGKWVIKSVDTLGNCVRLFSEPFCNGWSLAIYPGSRSFQKISKLPSIKSLGPCFSNEFDPALLQDNSIHSFLKDKTSKNFVPDLVEMPGDRFWVSIISEPSTPYSVRGYTVGANGRTDYIIADIEQKHVNITPPTVTLEATEAPKPFNKIESGDVIGYAIPRELGGPIEAAYNIFPQTRAGAKEWAKVSSEILSFLRRNESPVVLEISFKYENDLETRPLAFTYNVCYVGRKISFGLVLN